MAMRPAEPQTIRVAELLAALSLATDLAMNFPPETALRTCLVASQLARELGFTEEQTSEVFYTALLRHIGCTSFSHEEAVAIGDDNQLRSNFTGIDAESPSVVASTALHTIGADSGPLTRARRLAAFVVEYGTGGTARILNAHCDASRQLARQLGMPSGVVLALDHIFERWDGKGHLGLKAEAISPASRITHFAHTMVLNDWRGGKAAARAAARRRQGREFDPAVADIFLLKSNELMEPMRTESAWDQVLSAEPEARPWLPASKVDAVIGAFGRFADLKCAHSLGHSEALGRLVEHAASRMHLEPVEVAAVRRAALLHDLGRVGVSSGIWTKPRALGPAEWERVRLYPYHTERILDRAVHLRPIAGLAGSVQERLDSSGYHRRVPASMQSSAARLLATAHVYQALVEPRPYRPGYAPDQAAARLRAEVEARRLDPEAANAVLDAAGQSQPRKFRTWPAGLSDREVDVLRLVAEAKPNKLIARELAISEETVRNHVRHIYEKIDVQSRAGAALFAMEHDLIRR